MQPSESPDKVSNLRQICISLVQMMDKGALRSTEADLDGQLINI